MLEPQQWPERNSAVPGLNPPKGYLLGNCRTQKWADEEDLMLKDLFISNTQHTWKKFAEILNQRCHGGKPIRDPYQCRDRFNNHLDP